MRILAVADGGVATGFARVMEGILNNFPDDWELHHIAINYYGDPFPSKARLYPAHLGGDVYGIGRLRKLADTLNPDAILILQDSWVIKEYLKVLNEEELAKTVLYVPVDAGPYIPEWLELFPKVKHVCAYTEFGKNVLLEANPEIKNISVVPHGIDTNAFYPVDQDIARKALGKMSPDFKIFLNTSRNQPRKRLDILAKAFGIFSHDKDDVRYYHHAGVEDAGWDMIKMARRCGFADKLILTSRDISPQRYVSDETLNLIYNSADFGVNVCYAPGTKVFTYNGIKNIENIQIGETVFSHTGKESVVTNVFKNENKELLLEVAPYGIPKFTLSKNHELFADTRQYTHVFRPEKDAIKENLNLQFVPAKFLNRGSILTVPVITEVRKELDPDLAFVYGAFIAEGSVRNDGLVFSLHSGKPDNYLRKRILAGMKQHFGLDGHPYNMDRNRQNLTYFKAGLNIEFEELFGRGAHNKKLPLWAYYLNKEAKINLLYGFILGDGHISKKEKCITLTTVSEQLAWGLWLLLISLGGIAPSLCQKSRGEFVIKISGDSANNLCALMGVPALNSNKQIRDRVWADETFAYYPIRKIKEVPAQEYIYDLEVSGEHSYLTHVAGHNSMGEGWSLCFAEGTKVLTTTGYRKIEDIRIGDEVFDRHGKPTKVTNLFSREYSGPMHELKFVGNSSTFRATPEHPFYTEDGFVEAKDLTPKHMILRPDISARELFSSVDISHYSHLRAFNKWVLIKRYNVGSKVRKGELETVRRVLNKNVSINAYRKLNRDIKLDMDLTYLLLPYLIGKRGGTALKELDEKQKQAAKNIFNLTKVRGSTRTIIGEELIRVLNTLAYNEEIYLSLPIECIKYLYDGLLKHQSYIHPTKQKVWLSAKSVEKQNIIRIILLRLAVGFSEFVIKDGTVYFTIDKKYVDFVEKRRIRRAEKYETIEGYFCKVLQNDVVEHTGTVYNLETESHTYNVYGYAVHNCNMEHSIVGKPQIVAAHSALLELYDDGKGLLIPVSHYDTMPKILTEGAVVSVGHAAQAFQYAYDNPEEMKEMGRKAREYFLQDKFKWENISKMFQEIIEQ